MSEPTDEIARAAERIDGLHYRLIKGALLRTQLLCARHGALDVDWRTALLDSATEPVPDISEEHQQLRLQAAEEVANMPNADWEPEMRVGWRDSLESWYAATTQCLDDIDQAQRLLHREAGLSTEALEVNAVMDRDLVTASYRAGLTAAGLVSDWLDWLRGRVQSWPPGPRRETQLAELAGEDYLRSLQQLPRYWA